MHSLFRRAKAPAPMPMPMLSFAGKKALRFTGDTSAADLAVLMHARSHVVLASESAEASAAETAAALRAYLRTIYESEMMTGSKQQELRFAWRDDAGIGKKAKAPSSAGQEHKEVATEWSVALFALALELWRAAVEEDRRGADGIRRACAALSDGAGSLSAARRGAPEASGLCHMTAIISSRRRWSATSSSPSPEANRRRCAPRSRGRSASTTTKPCRLVRSANQRKQKPKKNHAASGGIVETRAIGGGLRAGFARSAADVLVGGTRRQPSARRGRRLHSVTCREQCLRPPVDR